MLWIYGVVGIGASVLFFLFVKEQPDKIAFDKSERVSFMGGIKHILAHRDMQITIFLFLIGLGIFNAVSSMTDSIAESMGVKDSNGLIGGLMLIGGILGAIIIPLLSDFLQEAEAVFSNLPGRNDPGYCGFNICAGIGSAGKPGVYNSPYCFIYTWFFCNECRSDRISICSGGQLSCTGICIAGNTVVDRTIDRNDICCRHEHKQQSISRYDYDCIFGIKYCFIDCCLVSQRKSFHEGKELRLSRTFLPAGLASQRHSGGRGCILLKGIPITHVDSIITSPGINRMGPVHSDHSVLVHYQLSSKSIGGVPFPVGCSKKGITLLLA